MDGFLLCRQWKADERLRRVPFVVYTATYRDPRDEQLARSRGADDFILEPKPSAVLVPRLRAALVRKLETKVEEFERERVRGRETEQRLSLALAAGAMGWWDWDLESGAIVWSDEHARLFGMQPGEFDGRYESFRNRLYPDDIEGVETAVDEARTQRTLYQREYRVIWPDGSVHWRAGRGRFLYAEDGRATRMLGVLMDIDQRKQQEARLHYLAYFDPLTGLANRSLFEDRLAQLLHAARRDRSRVATVWLDVDGFRRVNESFGRAAGDALLRTLAARLSNSLREPFTIAHVGGNSFAIALARVRREDDVARLLERRLIPLLGEPIDIGSESVRVLLRCGVALYPADGDTAPALITNTEAALRQAKTSGERIVFYAPAMNVQVAERMRTEVRLRSAIERGELVVHYQPRVSLRERVPVGLEALLRWQDPEQGLIPPARFVPVLEETGLVIEAGYQVLERVVEDCRRWFDAGRRPLPVAVNVSALQLRDPMFISRVLDAAQRMEELGGACELEITETVLMADVMASGVKLETLRGAGVRIALDDFGTGYSSLSYLTRFPIYALKVDRSFVAGMDESRANLAVVQTVVTLARSLGLVSVAEGVETQEQAAQLEALGCDEMQGFLFCRPVPADRIAERLPARNTGRAGGERAG